jgi:aromatic-L-amino-acid decarboxylase
VLTRHPQSLRAAFEVSTPYMPQSSASGSGRAPDPDNFKISTQWSRRMNALKLWLTLQVHGRQAYEAHIDRQMRVAHEFANWIERSREFELAAPVFVPIVNFRVKRETEAEIAEANERVVAEVTRDGRQWISTTLVAGRSVIRTMVISYFTDEQNVERLQDALTSAVQKVSPTLTKENAFGS